ncbi:hypothetical protein [Phytohabitans rumicis]|uniref:hypothetical protein n=1 Tax=Phytohabitans rumicis TaxID=1076125 RepID=UPI0031EE2AB0
MRFDNGVVKGGRSENPAGRLGTLAATAARLGLRVTHTWTSPRLTNMRMRERELLGLLKSMGRRTPGGREYFLHVPFTLAKAQMETWLKPGRHYWGHDCRQCELQDVFGVSATVVLASQMLGWRGDFLVVTVDFDLPCGGCFQAKVEDGDVTYGRLVLDPGDQVNLEVERSRGSWIVWAVTSGGTLAPAPALTAK